MQKAIVRYSPVIAVLLLGFSLLSLSAFGQKNLVQNPCFNDIESCKLYGSPENSSARQVFVDVKKWYHRDIYSPENERSPSFVGYHTGECPTVPTKAVTMQTKPKCGKGIVSMSPISDDAFAMPLPKNNHNWSHWQGFFKYRFNLLKQPLQKGNRYYGHFFVAVDGQLAVDKLGMKFLQVNDTSEFYEMDLRRVKRGSPAFYTDSIIPGDRKNFDPQAWHKVEGTFIADSNYNTLGIGMFFHPNKVDTLVLNNYYKFELNPHFLGDAFYSIDDIGVYEIPKILNAKDTTICKGDSFPVRLSGGKNYYLSKAATPKDTLSTEKVTWVHPDTTTAYIVNSMVRDTIRVRVFDPSQFQLQKQVNFCPGEAANLNKNPIPGLSYQWNTGARTPVLKVNEAGTYVLKARTRTCEVSDSVKVIRKEKPAPLQVKGKKALCKRKAEATILKVENNQYTSFKWYPMGQPGAQVKLNDTGTYTLKGQYWNGCKRKKTFEVSSSCSTKFFVPNAFSPNGDGVNDKFCPKGLDVQKYQLAIYNRFGEKVFETSSIRNCWDGTYKNKKAPAGMYTYIVHYLHKSGAKLEYTKTKSGTLNLIR